MKIRRFVTLIEMMVVIFLIGLILGFLAYNYRGSMEEGKALKTKVSMERLETILNMRVADEPDLMNDLQTNWEEIVKTDPLVKDPKILIYDAWGRKYSVSVRDNVIHVESEKFNQYQEDKKKK